MVAPSAPARTSGDLRRRCLTALAGGALLPFAFAPFDWWPLALVALASLFAVLARQSPRRAALLGWCWGAAVFAVGVWWIQVSVHQFGLPYYPFSVSVTTLFVAAMALYPALFAWLYVRLPAAHPALRPVILGPALWVVVEWLRATLFTGFPWLALGYSQIDAPLAGLAPLFGVPGVSFAIALSAGAAVALPLTPRAGRWLLVVAAGGLWMGASVIGQRIWTAPAGAALEAALIQGAVAQDLKWEAHERDAQVALYTRLSAAHWGVDVMVWPETAIPAFPAELPATLAALQAQATASGTTLFVGMPTGDPWHAGYYNSVVAFGARPGRYDKRHLVPFGEFFPFEQVFGDLARLLSIPLSDFSAGAIEQSLLAAGQFRAGISICYEDAFAREVARALPDAAFLVNVSNDAWFGDTIAPHQHLQIARMRARETGRDLLRATNTGVSALIDHRGRVTARAPQFTATTVRGSFTPRRGATPYTRWGDLPVLSAAGIMLAACAGSARRRNPSQS